MWRVEETHFNPQNKNYMTHSSNEMGMGFFGRESETNDDSKKQKKNDIILKRILKIME